MYRGISATLCSGALIAPNVVLPARHCLASTPLDTGHCGQTIGPSVPVATIEVSTVASDSTLVDDAGVNHTVQEVWTVPGGDDLCGFDLALLLLATPALEATAFVPRGTGPTPSERYSAIGYGQICADAADERCYLASGTRRRIDGLAVGCTSDCPPSSVAPSEWRGERGPCAGDSGGPALDDQGQLIGVALRGGTDDAGQCTAPVYGSISPWLGDFAEVVRRASASASLATPSWAVFQDPSDGRGDADWEGSSDGPSDAGTDAQDVGFSAQADSTDPSSVDSSTDSTRGSTDQADRTVETGVSPSTPGAISEPTRSVVSRPAVDDSKHPSCSCHVARKVTAKSSGRFAFSLLLAAIATSFRRRRRVKCATSG